jgi:hypothetical protein
VRSDVTDDAWLVLLHDWVVTAEHDGGYVLGRCAVCGVESLLDLAPSTSS